MSGIRSEKNKKFNPININNFYQGVTNQSNKTNVVRHVGLQPLGKVGINRRFPKNETPQQEQEQQHQQQESQSQQLGQQQQDAESKLTISKEQPQVFTISSDASPKFTPEFDVPQRQSSELIKHDQQQQQQQVNLFDKLSIGDNKVSNHEIRPNLISKQSSNSIDKRHEDKKHPSSLGSSSQNSALSLSTTSSTKTTISESSTSSSSSILHQQQPSRQNISASRQNQDQQYPSHQRLQNSQQRIHNGHHDRPRPQYNNSRTPRLAAAQIPIVSDKELENLDNITRQTKWASGRITIDYDAKLNFSDDEDEQIRQQNHQQQQQQRINTNQATYPQPQQIVLKHLESHNQHRNQPIIKSHLQQQDVLLEAQSSPREDQHRSNPGTLQSKRPQVLNQSSPQPVPQPLQQRLVHQEQKDSHRPVDKEKPRDFIQDQPPLSSQAPEQLVKSRNPEPGFRELAKQAEQVVKISEQPIFQVNKHSKPEISDEKPRHESVQQQNSQQVSSEQPPRVRQSLGSENQHISRPRGNHNNNQHHQSVRRQSPSRSLQRKNQLLSNPSSKVTSTKQHFNSQDSNNQTQQPQENLKTNNNLNTITKINTNTNTTTTTTTTNNNNINNNNNNNNNNNINTTDTNNLNHNINSNNNNNSSINNNNHRQLKQSQKQAHIRDHHYQHRDRDRDHHQHPHQHQHNHQRADLLRQSNQSHNNNNNHINTNNQHPTDQSRNDKYRPVISRVFYRSDIKRLSGGKIGASGGGDNFIAKN